MTRRSYQPTGLQSINHSNYESKMHQPDDKGDIRHFFKDLAMTEALSRKGIKQLFPVQYETYAHIYEGRDVVAKDRTGSGKTLAYTLPVLMKMKDADAFHKFKNMPKFLIIVPTRQLALQVESEINSLKVEGNSFFALSIYGGTSVSEQIYKVNRGADILIATPGRLIDFINRGIINFSKLTTTCLDEADEMLNMGFKDDIEKIFLHVNKSVSKVQNLLFSATIPDWIWSISERYQTKNRIYVDLVKNYIGTTETVEHYLVCLEPYKKKEYVGAIINYFLKEKGHKKVIVFCETKKETQELCDQKKIPLMCQALHGDIKQFMRERVYRRFKSGSLECIIATNVAARGLDFPDIDLVIQLKPPRTTDAYIHRSGRTGRAGKKGTCVTICSYREEEAMRGIERESKIQLKKIQPNELESFFSSSHTGHGHSHTGYGHTSYGHTSNGYSSNGYSSNGYSNNGYSSSGHRYQSRSRENYEQRNHNRSSSRRQEYPKYPKSSSMQKLGRRDNYDY